MASVAMILFPTATPDDGTAIEVLVPVVFDEAVPMVLTNAICAHPGEATKHANATHTFKSARKWFIAYRWSAK